MLLLLLRTFFGACGALTPARARARRGEGARGGAPELEEGLEWGDGVARRAFGLDRGCFRSARTGLRGGARARAGGRTAALREERGTRMPVGDPAWGGPVVNVVMLVSVGGTSADRSLHSLRESPCGGGCGSVRRGGRSRQV